MKKIITKKLTIGIVMGFVTIRASHAATTDNPNNEVDKASYSVGYMMGKNLKDSAKNLNADMIAKGVVEGFQGKPSSLTQEQMEKVIADYQEKTTTEIANKNLATQGDFMVKNAKKPGVITTKSGLQYQIITQGTGKKPKATDVVKVKYTGTLIDGTVFDSSDNQESGFAELTLNQVIPGWTEGVQLMPVGSNYRFFVPSKLAYGKEGAPQGGIEPNSALIFDVKLLGINPKSDQIEKQRY